MGSLPSDGPITAARHASRAPAWLLALAVLLAAALPLQAQTADEPGGTAAPAAEGAEPYVAPRDAPISLEEVMSQTTRTAGGSVRPPPDAVTTTPMEPGVARERDAVDEVNPHKAEALRTLGPNSDTSIWSEIRHGGTFNTASPAPEFLVQTDGMAWWQTRAKGGPLQYWSGIALGAILLVLVLFFLLRGKVRIEHGLSGQLVERFKGWERFGHWLLAVSFILLAITGLNLLFGRDILVTLFAPTAESGAGIMVNGVERHGWGLGGEGAYHEALAVWAQITYLGKWVHNNVAWAFMLSLVWIFFAWVWHNFPSLVDLKWIAQGGGLLFKNKHPPAKKFNFGQKIIFWGTILLGASVSASGLVLLFPGEVWIFGKTFAVTNEWGLSQMVFGQEMPVQTTVIQEVQYAQIWHTIVAIAMIVMIVAHIYIGSVGMQGAFAAMGSGMVDRNWAREHHGLWVDELDRKSGGRTHPAE